MWRAWGLTVLVAASLVLTNGALSANDGPAVHVKAVVKDGGVRLEAHADGPFDYTTYRPSESLYMLDLNGVSSADPAGARVVDSNLVKSYRVTTYASGQKPVVRLEVLLAAGVELRLERSGSQDLALLVSRKVDVIARSSAPSPAVPSLRSAATRSADTQAPGAILEAIEQVNLAHREGQTEVDVLGSGPLSYHAMRLQNPDRLVLDFAGSHLKTPVRHIPCNLDPVREVRLAQFSPETSRIVIDLREPARYEIRAAHNAVTVAFAAQEPAGGAAKAAPLDAPSGLMTTKTEAAKSLPGVESTAAKPTEIPVPPAVLPSNLTEPSSALAAPARVTNPQQQEAATATQLASQAAATATSASNGSAPAEGPAPATVPGPMPAVSKPVDPQAPTPTGRYSGEPISVNLKDVDLHDFFRLIHEISGLNVVVDPTVKGTLTIVLDDVPWDQALDLVLHNNDLDKQLDGNVLRIVTKDTVKKEAEQARDLAKAQAEAAEVVTTTRVLSYAKASDMVVTLKKFLSARGDILADPRSNSLIIRDVPSTLPVMDNLLRQLDRKSQQVEIEARVVAANRSFSREIGTQFGIALGNASRTNVVGGVSGVGTSPIVRNFPPLPVPPILVSSTPSPTSGSIPLNTNMPTSVPTSGISYAYSDPTGNFALDLVITAAEEKGVGKLLSKPKVITQNNQKATVKQGTKIPVQTVINNTVSVQFVDAVLELDVTPQITAEGTIHMDVNVENDAIDQSIPRVQGIPAIDTQAAQTSVTVNDGHTVVVGGIIVSSQRTDIQQVPLLGSLPLLGNLFKHTTVSSTSQELLFFLTPRILPD
jgi:type IV pilus assembly protein PilQ